MDELCKIIKSISYILSITKLLVLMLPQSYAVYNTHFYNTICQTSGFCLRVFPTFHNHHDHFMIIMIAFREFYFNWIDG